MVSQENKVASPQQIRKRRHQILRHMAKDQREERKMHNEVSKSNKNASSYFMRLYIVMGSALIVTIIAGLNYTRPRFLIKKKAKPQPPYYMATMYPPKVVVERDLPRFFRTYSIATPQNKEARKAVRRVAASRQALKNRTGSIKVLLKAWDSTDVDQLLKRSLCGTKFTQEYPSSSKERQTDLLMWCLLATRVTDGFFTESVEFLDNTFIVARRRGVVVQSSSSQSSTLDSYYLHPRNLENESQASLASVPSQVLNWLLSNPEDVLPSPSEGRRMLQDYIHELVHSEDYEENYMVLDEVCQPYPPPRAIAKQCDSSEDVCCYFVVPEAEGGSFGDSDDEGDGNHESLREGKDDEGEASS